VFVSEAMLHQTQVPRVRAVYDAFIARFPTPSAMAAAGPGAVIAAWDRLGYPRRARWLWEAATSIDAHGWPADLTELPGVGRYTAGAVAAQADDADVPAVDVNVRRVVERVRGTRLTVAESERAMVEVGKPLRGRDRLLALMDVGALLCRPREPRCGECPLRPRCASRGPLHDERRARQPAYAGSFRERRGRVLACLRRGSARVRDVDADALTSLVDDGLAVIERGRARLP
jgi:A/G-specific adenine glycosylase